MKHEARILAAMDQPMTTLQLSEHTGLRLDKASAAIKLLFGKGRVHISAWAPRKSRSGPPAAIYSKGVGVSPPRPQPESSAIVLAALPATTAQAHEKLGLSRARVALVLQQLHRKNAVHISGWLEPYHVKPSAIYSAGAGVDAPEPGPRLAPLSSVCRVMGVTQQSALYGTPWAGLESRSPGRYA